jgi:pyridoxine 5-phosphate synthase
MSRLRLGVNIDHVATLRNARGESYPDPLRAAEVAIAAGADGITAHLREDRRHIRDADIAALAALCVRLERPLNFEMAVTEEMEALALRLRPHAACLVPERREEVTTEGGLDLAGGVDRIAPVVRRLDARDDQVDAAAAAGAQVVEFTTGPYCDAVRAGDPEAPSHLAQLARAARRADAAGLEVHAGHGIDFGTVGPVAALPEMRELNIGHFLIGEAVFIGLPAAIRGMRERMDAARGAVGA